MKSSPSNKLSFISTCWHKKMEFETAMVRSGPLFRVSGKNDQEVDVRPAGPSSEARPLCPADPGVGCYGGHPAAPRKRSNDGREGQHVEEGDPPTPLRHFYFISHYFLFYFICICGVFGRTGGASGSVTSCVSGTLSRRGRLTC